MRQRPGGRADALPRADGRAGERGNFAGRDDGAKPAGAAGGDAHADAGGARGGRAAAAGDVGCGGLPGRRTGERGGRNRRAHARGNGGEHPANGAAGRGAGADGRRGSDDAGAPRAGLG